MDLAIYGAQGIALGAYEAIHNLYPVRKIRCFLVTERGCNAESLSGLPVLELSSFSDSLSEEYHAEKFMVADIYLYCYRASDMTPRFNPQKVRDLLHGLMDNLQFAKEHELEILFQNTVQRLEDEYVDIICRNLPLDELNILQLLVDINQIINRFYDRKSYVIQPLRTLAFGINQYSYRKALIDRIKMKNKIALYGAGKYGRLFFHFLKQNHLQNKVVCFIVSDLIGNPSEIEGIPVVVWNEFVQQKRRYIYVAVRGGLREEIRQILDGNKYEDCELIQEEFLHVIAAEVE